MIVVIPLLLGNQRSHVNETLRAYKAKVTEICEKEQKGLKVLLNLLRTVSILAAGRSAFRKAICS
jgi:hypothetical protein